MMGYYDDGLQDPWDAADEKWDEQKEEYKIKQHESRMQILNFETKEQWLAMRLEDITSTEVSALFGLNPWMTEYELWHRKKNKETVILEDHERMRWGNRLESAIAEGIGEDQDWMVHPFKDYGRLPELRAGSSFDYLFHDGEQEGLLEIKNVDGLQFKYKWTIEDGKVTEAPPHIELQVQHQMMITGHKIAYIGALVGGNSITLIKRTPDEKIVSAIKTKIIKFWNTIENNMPPAPDFERDADYLTEIYNYAEPDKVIDGNDEMKELAATYQLAAEDVKMAEKRKKAAKAELLTKIGSAEKVLGDGFTISAGVVGPTQVSYERKGYRTFRINFKKGKE